MQDDVLRIRAEVVVDGCVKTFVMSVLIDTGAQISLVKKGLFSPELFRPAGAPVTLRGPNDKHVRGGEWDIELDLKMAGEVEKNLPTRFRDGPGLVLRGRHHRRPDCLVHLAWGTGFRR
jgi:hypothetical protein